MTSSIRIYVPADAAAVSVGANAVAQKIMLEAAQRQIDISLVRNGSRGMLWLEPLVEIETPQGRIGFGPVGVDDVASVFEAGLGQAGKHPLALGIVDDLPWMKQQTRLTFARVGVIDPLSMQDYKTKAGLLVCKPLWL